MQLHVIKADGTLEDYLHTKVIATFSHALSHNSNSGIIVAEELAESVTFYLYNKYRQPRISSDQIFSVIKATLDSTGYFKEALVLTESRHRRELLRTRIEVTNMSIANMNDARALKELRNNQLTDRWNKSKIVNYLISNHNLDSQLARIIASMVEEKILASGLRCISTDFIKHLVLIDTNEILSACENVNCLQNRKNKVKYRDNSPGTDVPLRQQQNGVCGVEV